MSSSETALRIAAIRTKDCLVEELYAGGSAEVSQHDRMKPLKYSVVA